MTDCADGDELVDRGRASMNANDKWWKRVEVVARHLGNVRLNTFDVCGSKRKMLQLTVAPRCPL